MRGGATGAQGTLISIGALGSRPAAPAPALVSPPPAAAPAARPAPALPSLGGSPIAAAAAPPPAFTAIAGTAPRGGWSRRWPLVVAAVAAVAIIVSVAILVFGDDADRARKRRSFGPAPDRMQTDSLPTDPWARPQPGSGASLDDLQIPPPPPAPDIAPDDDLSNRLRAGDDDDGDPAGVAGGVVGGVAGGAIDIPDVHTAGEFASAAIDVGCQRLTSCWGAVPEVDSVCGQARALLAAQRDTLSVGCPHVSSTAAGQCLRQLAVLPCPDQGTSVPDLVSMVSGLGACQRACQ